MGTRRFVVLATVGKLHIRPHEGEVRQCAGDNARCRSGGAPWRLREWRWASEYR